MNEDDDNVAQPVNLVDLLDRLAEPGEPAQISMVPQTAGWAVLGILAALVLAWLTIGIVRRWRANAYRRAALAALSAAGDDPAAVAEILRRTALKAYGRTRVASLYGEDWLTFLDRTSGETSFKAGPGTALVTSPYRPGAQKLTGIGDLAARWVRRHRRSATADDP